MNNAIEFADNMFGRLKPEVKQRIEALLDNPCQETWEDAHCIIISMDAGIKTIWNAVLEVEPSYIRSKKMDSEWERIPTAETIRKALATVIFKPECLN